MEAVEAPWTVLTDSALQSIYSSFRCAAYKQLTAEQRASLEAWRRETKEGYGYELDDNWPEWEHQFGYVPNWWRIPEPPRIVPADGSPGDWLTLQQVVYRTGLQHSTVSMWATKGQLPSVKAGRLRLVHVRELARLGQTVALGTGVAPPEASATYRSVTPGLRFAVLMRDGFTCRYCGAGAPHVRLHVDHVAPQARGGAHRMDNLSTACERCNLGKHATTLIVRPTIMAGPRGFGCAI